MDKYQSTSDKIGYCIGYAGLGGLFGLIIAYQFRDRLTDNSFTFILLLGAIIGVGIAVYFHILHPEKAIVNNPDIFKAADRKEPKADYKYYILLLLAEVMNANKKHKDCEFEKVKLTIKRYYHSAKEQEKAFNLFKSIVENTYYFESLEDICNKASYELFYSNIKSEVIMELLAVAYADNDFDREEENVIKKIARLLGVDDYDTILLLFKRKYNEGKYNYQQSSYQSRSNNKSNQKGYKSKKSDSKNSNSGNHYKTESTVQKDSYTILGINSSMSDAEIKKAYHALAMKYHPDNAANLGDEAMRQATETMKQINKAWEVVKEARGLK